ncbi:MAG: J domain-containing protein [Epsilonproteobacteria bacterium]|nr:J domain-containing protein [Campylobacterota bacterium]
MSQSKAYRKIHAALEILGLPPLVTLKEITERYRTLAVKYHPDRGGDAEEMAKINEAYALLKAYAENYRFSFSEEEIDKQFPKEGHVKQFRF